MTINEYQKAAYRTANQSLTDSQQLQNGLMGLNGESGECIDILKNISSRGMISISITLPKSLEMWLGILR